MEVFPAYLPDVHHRTGTSLRYPYCPPITKDLQGSLHSRIQIQQNSPDSEKELLLPLRKMVCKQTLQRFPPKETPCPKAEPQKHKQLTFS